MNERGTTPPRMLLEVDALDIGIDTEAGLVAAVEALGLCIAHGETLALVGESGCGKSLTAAALMRLLPDAGVVLQGRVGFGHEDLLRISELRMQSIRGRRIGMVFQDPATALNPVVRVGAQIVEAIEAHTGLRGAASRAKAVEWLRRVGIPDPAIRVDDHPHQFSGGQQQRVMLAIALAGEPALLVADEPTSALDTTAQAQILDLLRELRHERRLSLLLVTHDLGVVAAMADRVALMYAGRIVEVAPVGDFLARPRHPYAQALLRLIPDVDRVQPAFASSVAEVPALSERSSGCRYAPRCDRAAGVCSAVEPRWSTVGPSRVQCVLYDPDADLPMPDTRADATRPVPAVGVAPLRARPADHGRPLLEVRDLRVAYRKRGGMWRLFGPTGPPAVDGVSFSVPVGRTLALIGESGCGKTTVAKTILQLLRRDADAVGRVLLDGVDLMPLRGDRLRQARRDVQIVFQNAAATFDPRLSMGDVLDESMRALRPEWTAGERLQRSVALLARVGLPADVLARRPHALSGGQRQRMAIARALCVEPRLLVCDEPTSALDVLVQAQVLGLLRELQRDLGLTCIVITHDLAVVRQLAGTVAVMDRGRIVCHGPVDTLFAAPRPAAIERFWRAVPRVVRGVPAPGSPVADA